MRPVLSIAAIVAIVLATSPAFAFVPADGTQPTGTGEADCNADKVYCSASVEASAPTGKSIPGAPANSAHAIGWKCEYSTVECRVIGAN